MQCKSPNSGPVLKGLDFPPAYKWKLNFQLCNIFGHCLSGIPIPSIESSASAQLCVRRGLKVGRKQIGVIWSPRQPFFNKIVNISQNSQKSEIIAAKEVFPVPD